MKETGVPLWDDYLRFNIYGLSRGKFQVDKCFIDLIDRTIDQEFVVIDGKKRPLAGLVGDVRIDANDIRISQIAWLLEKRNVGYILYKEIKDKNGKKLLGMLELGITEKEVESTLS